MQPPGNEMDEYASDDELEDQDLNLLNGDYAAQRDLSFFPQQYQPPSHYNPSIPPRLRQQTRPAGNAYESDEKQPPNTYGWEEGSPIPPRYSSANRSMLNGSDKYRAPHHNARAYQSHYQRRPLIDLIRNEWKTGPLTSASTSPVSSGYSSPTWIQVLSAPRFRRYVLVILGMLALIWTNWHFWAKPQWHEYKLLGDSLKERMRTGDGWFGENMRPEFLDMVHMTTLDQDLVPQKGERKRLIVIGDVHGCHDELVKLLSEVQYEGPTDHLIFAGDFISKGPSSSAVVDLAMSAHASCVRGNNEDRVLLAYRDIYSHRMTHEQKSQKSQKVSLPPMAGMPEDMVQNQLPEDEIDGQSFEHGDSLDRKLARSFTKQQIDYMASCPVILDVGQVKRMGKVHVVHAGLIPRVKLEKQDPMGVMHMRTVELDTFVPSSSAKGTAWYKLWNKYQSLIPSSQRSTIIYGHDSRRGLQLHTYTKGLDTGCVTGGKLTALIIDNNVRGGDAKTVSVQCKDHREAKKDLGETE